MKKVFDNLRAILTRHKENLPVVTVAEMLAEIDEEEAKFVKFEKDCCVWKWRIEDNYCEWEKPQNMQCCIGYHNGVSFLIEHYMLKQFKHCPFCGKFINILEVE